MVPGPGILKFDMSIMSTNAQHLKLPNINLQWKILSIDMTQQPRYQRLIVNCDYKMWDRYLARSYSEAIQFKHQHVAADGTLILIALVDCLFDPGFVQNHPSTLQICPV